LRRLLELGQYTSGDYSQTLDEHALLASTGTVGDALDNAMAESFVDTFKTELIRDRVWRSREQLELAIVEWVGWYNQQRLHSELGDIPPIEYEQQHTAGRSAGRRRPAPTPAHDDQPARRTRRTHAAPPSAYGRRLRGERPKPQLQSQRTT